MTSRTKRRKKHIQEGAVFLLPMVVLYTLFFVVPLIQGIYFSFTDWRGLEQQVSWVGFRHYRQLFTKDPYFLDALKRTGVFTLWNVILTNALAMLMALLLAKVCRLNTLLRTAIFLPNMISMVVAGFIWLFMFNKVIQGPWLSEAPKVIYAVVLVSVWHGVGYIMTIYIAGIQNVDDQLLEAGAIDGASANQVFWHIQLPLMLPVIGVGLFINLAGSLKIFDSVMSLTAGGPGRASEVAMINIYREAFVNNNMGYGAAKAAVLTLVIMVVAGIQVFITQKDREV